MLTLPIRCNPCVWSRRISCGWSVTGGAGCGVPCSALQALNINTNNKLANR
ncbi:hypothetical protein SB96558_5084 [Shigella boydii 965-58]|nr:hypothetical protein SB96558_5084 [Shigella boydii 965-58]